MRVRAKGKGIVAQETRVLIRETPRFASLAVTSLHKVHKRPRATRRRGSSRDVPLVALSSTWNVVSLVLVPESAFKSTDPRFTLSHTGGPRDEIQKELKLVEFIYIMHGSCTNGNIIKSVKYKRRRINEYY